MLLQLGDTNRSYYVHARRSNLNRAPNRSGMDLNLLRQYEFTQDGYTLGRNLLSKNKSTCLNRLN